MTRMILSLILLLALSSCTGTCFVENQFGADEFVLDSYKIREGKYSILELQGIGSEELESDASEGVPGKVEFIGLSAGSSLPVDGKVRLYDLLSQISLPKEINFFKSYLLRDEKIVPVDLRRLIQEGDESQNIAMKGGDKIYFAPADAASLMVMGEVTQQKVISVPNGFMSLWQALAEAGGIPYTGNKSYIQIIRGSFSRPKIYRVAWDHMIHLPHDSLLLIPGDIVYVGTKPITEWHRFLSQLIPSLAGL